MAALTPAQLRDVAARIAAPGGVAHVNGASWR
jgi:hypothetical protein